MQENSQTALEELFMLVQEFRQADDVAALGAMVTQRLHRFTPYDVAIFWDKGVGDITLASDTLPMQDAERLVDYYGGSAAPQEISLYELAQEFEAFAELNLAAPYGVYLPLIFGGANYGGLILLRTTAFSPSAQTMLGQCAQACAYSMAALAAGLHGAGGVRGSVSQYLFVAAFVALFVAGVLAGQFLF